MPNARHAFSALDRDPLDEAIDGAARRHTHTYLHAAASDWAPTLAASHSHVLVRACIGVYRNDVSHRHQQWPPEFIDALDAERSLLQIVCPIIKTNALDRLLSRRPNHVQVITRFNLADFAHGVSDLAAMRQVLDMGGQVRGIRHLHAKLYLFGSSWAIVTSPNLTGAGMNVKHEFGIVTDGSDAIARYRAYFDGLWELAGSDLQSPQLDRWDSTITDYLASGTPPTGQAPLKISGPRPASYARPIPARRRSSQIHPRRSRSSWAKAAIAPSCPTSRLTN